jgi:hypothetical protein
MWRRWNMRKLVKGAGLSVCFIAYLFLVAPLCLGDELIAPTRTLQYTGKTVGKLTIVSEPPDLDVFLDGSNIGKTPIWLIEVKPGLHRVRVKASEKDFFVEAGTTLQVSLFKGSFVSVTKKDVEVEKQPGPTEKRRAETRKTAEHPKEPPDRDLTHWDLFINRTLKHF